MIKNDYHVVAHSILSYLYDCLKQDKEISEDFLRLDWYPVELPLKYRMYIYLGLAEAGYIDAARWVSLTSPGDWDNGNFSPLYDQIQITAKGIDYLHANDLMVRITQGYDEKDGEAFSKINDYWRAWMNDLREMAEEARIKMAEKAFIKA